ncbi:NUDIX domain-containing protein [Pusillimonas sp.]|uniref:NUDIX hydrolase n=1 Tax=Pusillimonas sp. TaxID=3040095 RepID=UPI0029A04BC5|nr:NUDIX domain-containing protein [Pusillimonas sp.]MDX3895822.1 NUDIX domain-containing protein [Pusillimonas sp.]
MDPLPHTLHIATACFIDSSNALLVVRKRGTQSWMLPGGKLDAGETPEQAVVREVEEELQVALRRGDLTHLGNFQAMAANEPDTRVNASAFLAKLPGGQQFSLAAEIEAMDWLPLDEPIPSNVAPLLREHIIPALLAKAVIS